MFAVGAAEAVFTGEGCPIAAIGCRPLMFPSRYGVAVVATAALLPNEDVDEWPLPNWWAARCAMFAIAKAKRVI